MKLKVLIRPDQRGGFSATLPNLPGCESHGLTVQETLVKLREVATGWLETAFQDLDVEVTPDEQDSHALAEARKIQIPRERLLELCEKRRPPAGWFEEELKRPTG